MNELDRKKMYSRLKVSLCAGGVAEFLTLPICTTRTVLLDETSQCLKIRDAAQWIYRHKGFIGFFDSATPAVVSQMLSISSKFTMYYTLKDLRGLQNESFLGNVSNGVVSGVTGGLFAHPFDVIKTHKQRRVNFANELNRIGPKLLYRGFAATISKNSLLYGLLFPVYDLIKHKFSALPVACVAPLTSISTTLITQSVEYWKIRKMAGQTLVLRDAYRGYFLTLGRAMPHFTITMMLIERFALK